MSGRAIVVVAEDARCRRVALVSDGLELLWSTVVTPTRSVDLDRDAEAAMLQALAEAGCRGLAVAGLAWSAPDTEKTRRVLAGFARSRGLRWAIGRMADAILEGERLFGAARNVADVLVLDGDAPAVALRLGGQPHVGAHGIAGDIVHLGLDRTGAVLCRCGRHGCLGVLLSAGIAAPEPPRPVACDAAPSRELGWLGVAGITLLNVVNPELLVVAGALIEEAGHLAWFTETVRAGCLEATRAGLRAVTASRAESALLGTAALFAADRLAVPDDR